MIKIVTYSMFSSDENSEYSKKKGDKRLKFAMLPR